MTATVPADLDTFFGSNRARIEHELFDFLRIPSVSARSEHNADTVRAAQWLAGAFGAAGLKAEVIPTAGHPVVLGEWRGAGADRPTVLVYGHYDVQPAEPLELWTTPAFEPTVRDGRIYARGSVDDKGQLYMHVKAIEAHLRVRGRLPVNIIVLAEGEEEVGSDNLGDFVRAHRDRLRCDAVVISDSSMFAPGQPSILSSLRGLTYLQLDVEGPSSDLHSGIYGGAVINPATALARIIATFHDANGRIAIPGFYDSVRDWEPAIRAQMRALPFSDANLLKEVGSPALGGEAGYTTLERLWSRPTCEINGMLSGYTGEGAKTVLPSRAMAKVSCRLVPDQDPAVIEKLLQAHVERVAPPGVRVRVTHLHGGRPWRADLQGPLFDAATRALEAAFHRAPVIVGEGGSIPVVDDFAQALGAPILLMGFGLPGENAHAPDEWMSVENFELGMRAVATLWDLM
jgi:acetylornithine deacetylase/succinyl-diaminopimelate desuccinylase-like protein